MKSERTMTTVPERSFAPITARLGFWFAILVASLTAVTFCISIFGTPYDVYPYPYTPRFIPIDYAWLYPAILVAPVFVMLMACISSYAPDEKKVFSRIGLSFAVIYASLLVLDYFTQLAVVLPSTLAGQTSGLSLFTMYNPHGLFVSLEVLGYMMLSASLLAVAPLFGAGRIQRSIRWLFIGSFVLTLGSLAALLMAGYEIVVSEVAILSINWTVLIVSGVLLAVFFRRHVLHIQRYSERIQSVMRT